MIDTDYSNKEYYENRMNYVTSLPLTQQQQLQLLRQQQQQQQLQQLQQKQKQKQPKTPARQAPAPTEDDNGGGTTSIDTFQEYNPTALPARVVRACNEWYTCNGGGDGNNGRDDPSKALLSHADLDLESGSGHGSHNKNITSININDKSKSKTKGGTKGDCFRDDPIKKELEPESESEMESEPLTVPSHTSSACESALLSSVGAPVVPEETAEFILPLLQPKTTPASGSGGSSPSTSVSPPPPPPLSPLQLEGVLLSIQKHRRIHHPPKNQQHHPHPNPSASSPPHPPGAVRAGFFLGDGAGIGKGRQISAILRDSFCRGRRRHVWLSVSRELLRDAKRDLGDVGLHCATDAVYDGTRFLGEGPGGQALQRRKDRGILFLTYNLLVSANRIEQIIAWCAGTESLSQSQSLGGHPGEKLAMERAFDGCIVLDEAHKAKNLSDNTKTAQLVLLLQRRLPLARVVYCSATGVSDVEQLGYAERLGLWKIGGSNSGQPGAASEGPGACGSGEFADFTAFRRSLEQRGLGSLELLALELKTRGSLVARTLSWEGAEFQTEEVPLDRHQRGVYDRSVEWWNRCQVDLKEALAVTSAAAIKPIVSDKKSSSNSSTRQTWGTFWAAHQRFFKELAICAKVPFLARDALEHMERGCSVVFGLQGTGEASMQSLLNNDEDGSGDGSEQSAAFANRNKVTITKPLHKSLLLAADAEQRFPELLSTVEACLTNFVRLHFPVAPPPPEIPSLPKLPPTNQLERMRYATIRADIRRLSNLPPPEPIPGLVAKRDFLLDSISSIGLPPNPLDDLIDRLGGVDAVAEMTGRSGRVIRERRSGGADRFVYSKRVVGSRASSPAVNRADDADRINILERKSFMDGSKTAAIISDAASTGVSLHAARGSRASHRRRIHYTIELPWSADKAVQQLGRSHRSGQESAPVYKLVVTNLGGERRFAAAVSKRLASLGALTKGDRRAATGADLSEFDLDSKYGKRALKRLYRALEENEASGGESISAVAGILSSGNDRARTIVEDFLRESKAVGDPILNSLPEDDEKLRHACVLSIATAELDRIGLDRETRSKADVKVFLNRISGLRVARQTLVFSLFVSTLEGIVREAKSSGEFEGTAEDVTATSIEIGQERDLAIDPSSGATTRLTTLVLDRGISFASAHRMALEEAERLPLPAQNDKRSTPPDTDRHTRVNRDGGFLVSDDGDEIGNNENDEWLENAKARMKSSIAEPGFYVSKHKISGRYLIVFARRKFDRSAFQTEDEAAALDPLGLMQITRPNTGTSATDKSTRELRQAYKLVVGCGALKASADGESSHKFDKRVSRSLRKVDSMWTAAFCESDSFQHQQGLAPRRQNVSLVNGPVLHVLTALEKVVRFRSEREKALRIMRARVGSRRIVGVRFPSDGEAIDQLEAELAALRKTRRETGSTFTDEPLAPICAKTASWATTERKTMKSFFRVASISGSATSKASSNIGGSSNSSSSNTKAKTLPSLAGKKRTASNPSPTAKKSRATTMMSYFAKKK